MRNARCQTDEAVRLLGPGHEYASEALTMTWQFLFDLLTRWKGKKPKLTDLNTVAGAISKLAQSAQGLKKLEHDTREYEEQLSARHVAAEKALQVLVQNPGLPAEMREQLERELHIMG